MSEIVIKRKEFENLMDAISKIKEDLEALQEELEILMNCNLVEKIEEGLEDLREGRIYGIEEFKKAVKE
jgi:PHD/YefM family antitoxin component YafN of YafNO toxin-antitoxin module